jgi:hypothetical protein
MTLLEAEVMAKDILRTGKIPKSAKVRVETVDVEIEKLQDLHEGAHLDAVVTLNLVIRQ